jgi:hypothetical protein
VFCCHQICHFNCKTFLALSHTAMSEAHTCSSTSVNPTFGFRPPEHLSTAEQRFGSWACDRHPTQFWLLIQYFLVFIPMSRHGCAMPWFVVCSTMHRSASEGQKNACHHQSENNAFKFRWPKFNIINLTQKKGQQRSGMQGNEIEYGIFCIKCWSLVMRRVQPSTPHWGQ